MRRKGMICVQSNGRLHEKPLQRNADRGKNAGTYPGTRFPWASYFEKMRNVFQKHGGACTTWHPEYKRYDLQSPNGHLHEKPSAKGGTGKVPVLTLVPGSHKHLALRKCVMCARNMGVHVRHGTRRTKDMRKWNEKLDSRAAKKGARN